MLYSPLLFVCTTVGVPFTTTETPESATPTSRVTLPVTVLVWANACDAHRSGPMNAVSIRCFIIMKDAGWW